MFGSVEIGGGGHTDMLTSSSIATSPVSSIRSSQSLGRHLHYELYDTDPSLLNDLAFIESTLRESAHLCGATIVNALFHSFEPQGVTGVLILAESHLSIHTYPERGFAAGDVFTCGAPDPRRAARHLIEQFSPRRHLVRTYRRGVGL